MQVQNRQIDKLMRALHTQESNGKELAMTYWAARDKQCHNGSNIPHGRHNHFDAGLCLWRPGKARALACNVGDFMQYCCNVLHQTGPLPRAIDEALADAFLSGSGVHAHAVFERHVHKIRAIKPSKSEMLTGKEDSTRSTKSAKSARHKRKLDGDEEENNIKKERTSKKMKEMELPKDWTAVVHAKTDTCKKYTSYLGPMGQKCRSMAEVLRCTTVNQSASTKEEKEQPKRKRVALELPPGFSKVVTVRKSGATTGQKDVTYIENKTKTKFRSLTGVAHYLQDVAGSTNKKQKNSTKSTTTSSTSSSSSSSSSTIIKGQKAWLLATKNRAATAAKMKIAKVKAAKSKFAKIKTAKIKAAKIEAAKLATEKQEAAAEAAKEAHEEEMAAKLAARNPKKVAAEARLEARQHLESYVSRGMRVEEMYLDIGPQGSGEVFVCGEKVQRKEIAAGRATTKNEV